MTTDKAGGSALIVSSVMMIVLVAFHPTHGGGAPVVGPFTVQGLVHATAILSAPLAAFGTVILARHIGLARPLAGLGLVTYLFGAVALMAAATISGLVTSEVVTATMAADGADRETFGKISHLSVWLNRGFANVHVAFFSIALILWGLASRETAMLRITGLVGGVGILAWQASGTLQLTPHTLLIIVIVQGGWLMAAAVDLLRKPGAADAEG